jgi:hypothetical protein
VTRIFTASWPALHRDVSTNIWAPLDVLPVRISRDTPKFWPRAQSFPAIEDLIPDRWMASLKDLDRAGLAYRRKLDEVGIRQIQNQLDHLAATYQRPLVLACFETDLHYRHRGPAFSFDGWYEVQTGIEVPEWEPDSGLASTSHTDLSGPLRLVWDRVASLGELQTA